tara:strand:+ start:12042 stop:12317 length:276 start_codon:yes stop_codon:yes gene_type:complete
VASGEVKTEENDMITEFSRILYMIEETEWKLHELREELSDIKDQMMMDGIPLFRDGFMDLEYRRREIKSEIAEAEKELHYWNHQHQSDIPF